MYEPRSDNAILSKLGQPPMIAQNFEGRRWIPFPIYVVGDDEVAIVPNDRMLEYMLGNKHKIEEDEALKLRDPKVYTALLESAVNDYEKAAAVADTYRLQARLFRYYVSKPLFGEFLNADEQSKSYVNGSAQFDRNLMMRNLMPGKIAEEVVDQNKSVRMRILQLADILAIEVVEVGVRLYEELYARCFGDSSRIPFLGTHSQRSKPESPSSTEIESPSQ